MFHVTSYIVKKCENFNRKDSYLINDFATFQNILLHRDEAMVQSKLYNLA